MSARQNFTPALGIHALTPLYDLALAAFTRERRWRGALVVQVAPRPGERILDIGCGTGTLARALKQAAPDAVVIGLDPDPRVLVRARAKAAALGLSIEYHDGFFDQASADAHGPFDTIVTSLVLHQVPLETKRAILAQARAALRPGGAIHIADYGLPARPPDASPIPQRRSAPRRHCGHRAERSRRAARAHDRDRLRGGARVARFPHAERVGLPLPRPCSRGRQ
jgi:SAM-dependent methyltransferase